MTLHISICGTSGGSNQVNFHLYHYAGNNPVKYVDPDGRETKQHTELSGIKRGIAEIADCFGFTIKGGLGLGITVKVGIFDLAASYDYGSREITVDKNGETHSDVSSGSFAMSVLGLPAIGSGFSKSSPATDSSNFADIIQNAREGEISQEITSSHKGAQLTTNEEGDAIIEAGFQIGAGGSVFINLSELKDIGNQVLNGIKKSID